MRSAFNRLPAAARIALRVGVGLLGAGCQAAGFITPQGWLVVPGIALGSLIFYGVSQ